MPATDMKAWCGIKALSIKAGMKQNTHHYSSKWLTFQCDLVNTRQSATQLDNTIEYFLKVFIVSSRSIPLRQFKFTLEINLRKRRERVKVQMLVSPNEILTSQAKD